MKNLSISLGLSLTLAILSIVILKSAVVAYICGTIFGAINVSYLSGGE